jgi:hypothetical protein
MSKRLVELMKGLIAKEGSAGRARLSLAAERRERMIERYMSGASAPSQSIAYKLALACGCTEDDSTAIAAEYAHHPAAKETA